ncbi:MAG: bacteriohemerythrin [Bryobacteraceae bacterium]|jgi:hemerythrin
MQDLFAWSDEYSLGQPDIDREHKALFRMAQELNEAMLRGEAQEELAGLFARLAAYTKFHFTNEEALMRAAHYADAASHAREHNQFTAKVAALEREFEDGQATVTRETMQFLRGWLNHHILGTDQRVARHLRGAG